MECPHCGKEINIGALLGSATSDAKAKSSRANGALGGRPRKKKRAKRDANVIAHDVVRQAEQLTQRARLPRTP